MANPKTINNNKLNIVKSYHLISPFVNRSKKC